MRFVHKFMFANLAVAFVFETILIFAFEDFRRMAGDGFGRALLALGVFVWLATFIALSIPRQRNLS